MIHVLLQLLYHVLNTFCIQCSNCIAGNRKTIAAYSGLPFIWRNYIISRIDIGFQTSACQSFQPERLSCSVSTSFVDRVRVRVKKHGWTERCVKRYVVHDIGVVAGGGDTAAYASTCSGAHNQVYLDYASELNTTHSVLRCIEKTSHFRDVTGRQTTQARKPESTYAIMAINNVIMWHTAWRDCWQKSGLGLKTYAEVYNQIRLLCAVLQALQCTTVTV